LEAAVAPAFSQLSSGGAQNCALTSTGQAYCWGGNLFGQLGIGSTVNSPLAVPVHQGGLVFNRLAVQESGGEHTCALTVANDAYCWGWNGFGQLGDGTTTNRLVPTPVFGGIKFLTLSAGSYNTCGLTSSGQAYCWGHNSRGQIGDGTTVNRLTPTPVQQSGLTFRRITAGGIEYACGLTAAGSAYCWGQNPGGQLGSNVNVGTTLPNPLPLPVQGGLSFRSIAANYSHVCGVTQSGVGYCWGSNHNGQLGNGVATASPTPTPQAVLGGLSFQHIAPGDVHTCALSVPGATYCWGINNYGQLGQGMTPAQSTLPLQVQMRGLVAHSVRAHNNGGCAMVTTRIFCWGHNSLGQLGDGTTINRYTPVRVK